VKPAVKGRMIPRLKFVGSSAATKDQIEGSFRRQLAILGGATEMTCTLDGRPFAQEPQKYHAKSLGVLRERYAKVADKTRLDPILERAGCASALRT